MALRSDDAPAFVGVGPASDDPHEELQLARRDLREAEAERAAAPGYRAALKVQQMRDRLARAERAAAASKALA